VCVHLLVTANPTERVQEAVARLELQHAGAQRLHERAVVRHEQDGEVVALQVGLHPLDGVHVHVVRRLIQNEQVRPRQKRRR
jgi:hypothetical protein